VRLNSVLPLTVTAVVAAILSGCAAGPRITEQTDGVRSSVGTMLAQFPASTGAPTGRVVGPTTSTKEVEEATAQARAVARYASRPFVGSKAIAMTGDERLPSVFFQPVKLDFSDSVNGAMPVEVFFQRVASASGVATRVSHDVWDFQSDAQMGQAPGASGPAAASTPLPIPTGVPGGLPTSATVTLSGGPLPPAGLLRTGGSAGASSRVMVNIKPLQARSHPATLLEALNYACDQLGIAYTYQDGVIVVQRFLTETVELDFGSEGITDAKMKFSASGTSSSGTGGSGSTDNAGVQIDQTGKLDLFNSAVGAIREVVSKTPGSSVVSTDFGRIVVTTTKDTMVRARELARSINKTLQRRVAVSMDVYYMTSNDSDQKGFNWSIVYQSLNKLLGVGLTAPASLTTQDAAGAAFSIIPASAGGLTRTTALLGNTSLVLNTLRGTGYNAYVKSFPTVLNNRTWSRDMQTDNQFFVAEITPGTTSVAGATAVPGVKLGQVTTGDDVALKARILDSGRICLTVNASFGDLLGIDKANWGSSGYYTQQPHTSNTSRQREFCHDPGETIIFAGMSKLVATGNQNTLDEHVGIIAGGSRVLNYQRQNMMIVLRATPI